MDFEFYVKEPRRAPKAHHSTSNIVYERCKDYHECICEDPPRLLGAQYERVLCEDP